MRKSHEKIGRSIESRIHDMTGALLVNGSMNAAALNKAYRGTKKQELWDNYLAIVAAVETWKILLRITLQKRSSYVVRVH